MQKSFFGLMFMLVTVFIFSSCRKSNDTNIPYIFLKSGGNYISLDGNIVRGDTILVGVNAASNGLQLANFSILSRRDNAIVDSTYYSEAITTSPSLSNYIKDFQIIIQNHAGKEQFTFQITDSGNQSETKIIVLTVL